MRFIYFFFLIFFTAFIQVSFPLSVAGITLDIVLLAIIYGVLYLPIEQSLLLAFIGGVILDAFSPLSFGSYALTRVLLAYSFGVYFKLMLIKNPLMAGVGVAVGCFVESLLLWALMNSPTDFFIYLFTNALPQGLFMGFVSIILFRLIMVRIELTK